MGSGDWSALCFEREPFLSFLHSRKMHHQDYPYRYWAVGRRRFPIGESALKTFQYLVDELNANGGLNGKRVEWVGFDNKLDPQISLVQAQKAADQGFRICHSKRRSHCSDSGLIKLVHQI